MTMSTNDFVKSLGGRDKTEQDFSLYCPRPRVAHDEEANSVLVKSNKNPRELGSKPELAEDGLYTSNDPFTNSVTKPYQLNHLKMLNYNSKPQFCGKLLEIAVRAVTMHLAQGQSDVQVTSVSILFKKKVICKANAPFNRKLYKLLLRNSEHHNLSIQVEAEGGHSSVLPLPLPRRCVKDQKIDIDFAICDRLGRIHSGTMTCTISLIIHESQRMENSTYLYRLSNDPNDPQNGLSLRKPKTMVRKEDVKYFSLEHPGLIFDTQEERAMTKTTQQEKPKPPDIIVVGQDTFSVLEASFKNFFQAKRPLRSSAGTRGHHTFGKTILSLTILRAVEVPVREESAVVQPLVEVEWSNVIHSTSIAEGPAPIWNQTIRFELPRQNTEDCVKLRLCDQHPVWGQQWLGEARIPLESHRNYQELERWIPLSPLYSPVLLFGYVSSSPGQSHTRIYILMKLEQPGNAESMDKSAINTLCKGIQRCLTVPYKINGIETPEDAARLVMLVSHLPAYYGPLTARQALNVNKIDHYGRAALLATLLEGFDLETFVLLGSSQTSKWSAFVLSKHGNENISLWDPEIGEHYSLTNSRCTLLKVCRLIDHTGMWENTQKNILPHNLRYDPKTNKDWRPLGSFLSTSTQRTIQTLEMDISAGEEQREQETAMKIEEHLRDKLSEWRSTGELTTIFNRHAVSLLRNFISKAENVANQQLDRKELKQLYRAYHMHGFILSLREASVNDLAELLSRTKVHNITGPVEFAIACHVQRYIGKTCSVWLAVVILRSRD